MTILFYTFPEGHLVSDREFDRMRKGFSKLGMELIRWHAGKGVYEGKYDIVMVKGWSHRYQELPPGPLVYLSIGTEWKIGEDLKALNDPIWEIYEKSQAVIHISEYCKDSHRNVFPKLTQSQVFCEQVIIPACEPNLPVEDPLLNGAGPIKLAITCIPRPVKRIEETERLCKKYGIELVPAYGNVSDFSYYHQCHGGICLSRKEGMPNNVLEMMAAGLPCIVTNYGGAKEAIGDADIVIKNDPQNAPWNPAGIEPIDDLLFARAIEDFIANYKDLRHKVRERVRSQLNDLVSAAYFKEVFQKLL